MSLGFNVVILNISRITNIKRPIKKPKKNIRKIEKYFLNLIILNFEIIRKKIMYEKFNINIIIASNPAFFSKGASLLNINI
jgi:hypothetical protein